MNERESSTNLVEYIGIREDAFPLQLQYNYPTQWENLNLPRAKGTEWRRSNAEHTSKRRYRIARQCD